MKMLAQTRTRVQRPTRLLEWHRWFAWHPVTVVTKENSTTRGFNLSNESGARAYTVAILNGATARRRAHVRDRYTPSASAISFPRDTPTQL
jgi:hypothetical protein